MCTDKVNAVVGNEIQVTGITLMDVYLSICTFVFISAILAAASRAGENVLMLAICVGLIVWAVGMAWAASPASP